MPPTELEALLRDAIEGNCDLDQLKAAKEEDDRQRKQFGYVGCAGCLHPQTGTGKQIT